MNRETALARLTVAPALLVVAWLAVSLPLLLAGKFSIGLALSLFVPVAVVVVSVGCRGAVRGPVTPVPGRLLGWWPVIGLVLVAVAFFALQLIYNSEQIIVRRDPATYAQFTAWLTEHGSLPMAQSLSAFGGADPALRFDSPAFYVRGDTIVPQFMAGLPLLLALGGWIGGTQAMLGMAPLLGACAVLSFGGLVGRLVGPLWAPVGALAFALCWPILFVSRSTYSESAALVLLLGGLCLMHDVRDLREGRFRAFLAGLALGLTVLVRIDGLRDILPVVVFAGLLFARRRRTGVPLFLGLALGAGAGLVEGFTLSAPYFNYLSASLRPLLYLSVAVLVLTLLMVLVMRWQPALVRRLEVTVGSGRLPDVAAVLTVLLMIGFAVRPYVQTVRRIPASAEDQFNSDYIKSIQQALGMELDGNRQYTELSLYWVVWYIGIPALLMATFGAALLVRRLLRRGSPEWLLPYSVIVFTTVMTLVRPGITPDQPWASRRLASVVIPGLLLFALWALAWATRRVRRLGYGRVSTFFFAFAGSLVLIVPIVWTSGGLMFTAVEQGEVRAVNNLCQELGQGSSVLIVERVTADRFSPVVRNMCGLPTARMDGASSADVQRIAARIVKAGRRPIMLGANAGDVSGYGTPRQVVNVRTRQDGHALETRPKGTWSLTIPVWMADPSVP
jgi:hypothetical protein